MSAFKLSPCPHCPALFRIPADLEIHLQLHADISLNNNDTILKEPPMERILENSCEEEDEEEEEEELQENPLPPLKEDGEEEIDLQSSSSSELETTPMKNDPSITSSTTTTNPIPSKSSKSTNNNKKSPILIKNSAGKIINPKKGLESSILATLADTNQEKLIEAYQNLPQHKLTGKPIFTKEFISSVYQSLKEENKQLITLITKAQCVSICFLVDTTGSMSSHIEAVKTQIFQMVKKIQKTGCVIGGLAFVGYKDWIDGDDHFEILSFLKNIKEFEKFVGSIGATGGGDAPEDVLGGLNKAIQLNWLESSGTRIIFHLADAPPHGRQLFKHSHRDDYPNGHPSDRDLTSLFDELNYKEIDYYFGKINSDCDSMIEVFEEYLKRKIVTMECSNTNLLTAAVIESVKSSVSSSCEKSTNASKKSLSASRIRNLTIVSEEPDWSTLPIIPASILQFKFPENVETITSFAPLEQKLRYCKIQVAPSPFSKGGVRYAYYGKLLYNPKIIELAEDSVDKIEDLEHAKEEISPAGPSTAAESVGSVVLKEFITVAALSELERQRYLVDLEVQTVASKLAIDFNDRLGRTTENPNLKLKFLMAKVIRIDNPDGSQRYMAIEKKFRDKDGEEAKMVKYTNNLNYVVDGSTLDKKGRTNLKLALAFSHFSYCFTKGYLLVTDLQGIDSVDSNGSPTLLLTDPAIHCSIHARFGKTNLRGHGILAFFRKHHCNEYCQALGLEHYEVFAPKHD